MFYCFYIKSLIVISALFTIYGLSFICSTMIHQSEFTKKNFDLE